MKRLLLAALVSNVVVAAAGACPAALKSPPIPKAAWTVLVFLNGDNNLEPMAVLDFAEMRKVAASPQVNVVVLFDRIGDYQDEIKDSSVPKWSRTVLFKMTPGTRPRPEDGIDLKQAGFENDELDMGDPLVLKQFVKWGRHRFPAERYALVIWDHGQGWRAGDRKPGTDPFRSAKASPMKAVSFDDTSGHHLYNRDIQNVLSDLGPVGHFDVLGFDACLMAMLESAYAFRGVADWMVGSEDLEPGYGWDYESWLGELVKKPSMDGAFLARTIVRTYEGAYAPNAPTPDPTVTMSAIQLDRVDAAASALNALAQNLEGDT
jgi:clostripain